MTYVPVIITVGGFVATFFLKSKPDERRHQHDD